MAREHLEIALEQGAQPSVGAILDSPDGDAPDGPGRSCAILLAHGAGAGMDSDFMEAMARGLCDLGLPVLRFNYPYMQASRSRGSRRPPDRIEVLEATHARALAKLRDSPAGQGRRILLAGKSLGGRVSTLLAARGEDCAGLILLGYPLHPPGRPEKERREHFPAIAQPALFLQGTNDALCGLSALKQALATYGGTASLHVIEGADHGFHVPRRSGRSDKDLRAWYHKFMVAEAGHYKMFIGLAELYFGDERSRARWKEYLLQEAGILQNMDIRGDRMH